MNLLDCCYSCRDAIIGGFHGIHISGEQPASHKITKNEFTLQCFDLAVIGKTSGYRLSFIVVVDYDRVGKLIRNPPLKYILWKCEQLI